MLLLVSRIGEWTYARLVAVEVDGDDIAVTCIPRPDDTALADILSGNFRAFGLACEALVCHAAVKTHATRRENGEERLRIDCRRVALMRTLDLVAEEKAEQMDNEWDKPSRDLGRYDGMMGFAAALPARPGFVTLVNQVAWRTLLGRDMPVEYGHKGRVSILPGDSTAADPNIRKLLGTPCPFRLLLPVLGHSPNDYLALSRLFASYLLIDRGVVDVIREFDIEYGPDEQVRISFLGRRAGVTKDDLPIQVMVRGTFLPGLTAGA